MNTTINKTENFINLNQLKKMKTKLNILSKLVILFLMFATPAFSQWCVPSTINMYPGTNKGVGINGGLNILKSICLPNTTSLNDGVIYKGGNRFLHNWGTNNTFLGVNSGNFTMGGPGSSNVAVGFETMLNNTTGSNNVALGYQSMFANTTGSDNSAVGLWSLRFNTTGNINAAFGEYSLYANTTGGQNTALGNGSLRANISGGSNTAVGVNSLATNTIGTLNSAVGYLSLYNNTTGTSNSALGDSAGFNITTGNNNTAIGQSALVPNGTASNQVRVGNTRVTYAGVQVAWTITSDRRLKSDINNSNLGLNFISKLNPVSYTRNNDEKQKTEYGFIAQEVEDELKESGVDNSGMVSVDDKGMYSVRYNDLLAPMVKAIQELKVENDKLKENNGKLALSNENLKSEVETLKTMTDKIAKLEQTVNILTSVKHTSLINEVVNSTNSK